MRLRNPYPVKVGLRLHSLPVPESSGWLRNPYPVKVGLRPGNWKPVPKKMPLRNPYPVKVGLRLEMSFCKDCLSKISETHIQLK